MRREVHWASIEQVASNFETCIAPGNGNNAQAKLDFMNYGDRIRYYSFPLEKARGYVRLILARGNMYLDFINRPTSPETTEYLKYLTKKSSSTCPVYLAGSCVAEMYKGLLEVQAVPGRLNGAHSGIKHTIYVTQNQNTYRILG